METIWYCWLKIVSLIWLRTREYTRKSNAASVSVIASGNNSVILVLRVKRGISAPTFCCGNRAVRCNNNIVLKNRYIKITAVNRHAPVAAATVSD